MFFIAHRGNINGPSEEENSPLHIDKALSLGYDAEVDVWINDTGLIFLGHDKPEYIIDAQFLEERHKVLWCHAKNVYALKWLVDNNFNTFFHDTDDYVLTSKGYIWCYPGKNLVQGSICVMPEMAKDPEYLENNKHLAHAVCSDYLPEFLK
ncbi:hypothetical protein FR483_N176R [Paramecium bursaria Chlorella virus FR483]|uniref:Uncharacterized protein N176R n=1 Tax=Paramecium bursaria Chlorella virus FR483 TaxID=399781 RepID=A7J6N0_PBCVF|nr:hypothetical protein FR483_N176R [Paramecium bursaria Chlorella virus FR483]ABT15461.1 hypothetical protein FR483_N176R [Paramecium bursaria Chlorella virus FR483]